MIKRTLTPQNTQKNRYVNKKTLALVIFDQDMLLIG
jgi:hypothetical protein